MTNYSECLKCGTEFSLEQSFPPLFCVNCGQPLEFE